MFVQAASRDVKKNNQDCLEMFKLNTEVVIVGFFKAHLGDRELNAELPRDAFEEKIR